MPQKVFLVGIELNPRAKNWRATLVDSLKTQTNEEFHFLDETNILPGSIIIDKLIDFIRNCDKTVLVITPEFFNDPSCSYAADLALSLENDTKRARPGSVVVVLLQDTIVPYKYTHKRDVIHHDDPEFLKKLSKQLSKELEWGTKPLVYGIQVHNLHNFLERTDDVVFIAEPFMGQVPQEGGNMFGISGAPGIGKTSLAKLICRYIYRRTLLHIYWIHCGKAPDVVKIISGIRRHLLCSESQVDFADRISARSWLIQFTMHEKILFVLDDVWNPDDASVFTAISKDCLLLITTRDRAVLNVLNVREYPLDHLDVENAWQLFLKCANVTEKLLNDHEITKEANAIHRYLGGYPLAIALVASSLRQGATSVSQSFSSQRWRDMAASLKEKDKLWMESRRLPIDSYPETFVGAFEATFACLRDAGDTNKPYSMLQEILLKVSLFKKDTLIQSSTLAILCSYMQDKSNAEKQHKVARRVRECLFTLADKSLLKFKFETNGDCYFRIHDLVLQYIQNKTETLWGPDGIRRMHTALLAAYVAAAEGTSGLQHIEKLPNREEPAAERSTEKDRSDSGFQDDLEHSVERHSPCKDRPIISGSNTNSCRDQLGCCSCYEFDRAIVLSYPWWNLDFSGDKYVYTNFIHHCTAMGKKFESFYGRLLCSFRWLQAKLNKTSLSEIISDFELFECRPKFSRLHEAINKALLLHAPAITRDKKQLGPVFLGSLSNLEIIGISDFLKAVRSQLFEDADSCFLPDRACISPPHGHVVKTYSAHNGTAVLGLGVLKDSSIVTTSGDGFVRLIDQISGEETCLGSDLTKHNDLVTCFGVNSSETLVVTAACDSVVKLWDLKGKCLRETFSNIHNRQIFSLVLSANGESGLTVSGDKTIKLWYLNDGSVQFTYAAHTDVVACACFTNLSEKEIFFASCSYDETVCLWRKNRPEGPVTSCNPKLGVLYTLFFSTYQRQLYVGGKTGIGVLNFPSLEVRQILKGHEGGTFALCLARYESYSLLLSGGDDGRVKFWDVNDDHSLVFQVQIHSAAVRGIQCAFKENMMTIYTASVDQSVKQSCFFLSSLDSSSAQSNVPNHEGPVSAMTSASNERYAISVSWDRQVIVWDSSNGTAVNVIGRHDDGDRITTVSSHGNRCFTGSQTGTLHVWNLEDESQNALSSYVHPASIGTLTTVEDHTLVVGLHNGDIHMWDIQSPTQTAILRVIKTSQFGIRHLRVTPECSIAALCDNAITTLSYERDCQEQRRDLVTVKIKNMPPFPIVPLPKFKQIIIGFDEDSRLRTLILEIERNSKINSGLPKVEIATALAISEDQEHLVCGSDNGSVTIVTRHGKTLSTLPRVSGKVKCIELLPNATSMLVLTSEGELIEYAQGKDGEAFPYCSQWTRTRWHIGAFHIDRVKALSENLVAFVMHGDNIVQLWDLPSRALVFKFSAPSATRSILVLQKGTLLTGSSDGQVCFWNLKDSGKALKPRIRVTACHAPFGVEHLCCTPDQALFLTASSDNKIGVHETVNGNLVRVISTQGHYGMRCISVSSDGKFVMCCHKDIFAQMIDLTTGIPSKQMLTYNTAWSQPRSCSGSCVFTEGPKCTINTVDINSGDSMNLLGEQTQSKQYAYAHTRAVTAIVPYGDNHIITGSYDKSIILWLVPKNNVKESRSLCQFYFEHIVTCLLVMGRKLCVGLKNGTVNFLNVQLNEKKVSCESASIRK